MSPRQSAKLALRIFAGVLAAFAIAAAALLVLSEQGEVARLRSFEADGTPHWTRLWIVDDGGAPWLRCGGPARGWCRRVAANPDVELERNGEILSLRAVRVDEPGARERIDARMAAKYGFIDALILRLEGGAQQAYPLRLEPRAAQAGSDVSGRD